MAEQLVKGEAEGETRMLVAVVNLLAALVMHAAKIPSHLLHACILLAMQLRGLL